MKGSDTFYPYAGNKYNDGISKRDKIALEVYLRLLTSNKNDCIKMAEVAYEAADIFIAQSEKKG